MKTKFCFLIALIFSSSLIYAEPYLAIREGLKCSSCHMNKTGGGQRTQFGAGFGVQDLPWKNFDLQANHVPMYWSAFNDLLAIGGDFRAINDSTISDNKIETNNFAIQEAELYLHASLIPDHLSFYADEAVAPNGVQSREIFAMVNLPERGWIKAGKFVLPYGLRLLDDKAFIRGVTGFSFLNPDVGAEIGFEPGNFSFITSVTNGTAGTQDNNTDKQIVGTVAYVPSAFRIGASASYNRGPQQSLAESAGVWGGFRFHKAALLGEVDRVRNELNAFEKTDQFVAHAEIDYLIYRGWNVKVAYEYFDPNTHLAEDQRDRVVVGIEPFITPFFQVSAFYQFNQSIPQDPVGNTDEFTIQAHIYF